LIPALAMAIRRGDNYIKSLVREFARPLAFFEFQSLCFAEIFQHTQQDERARDHGEEHPIKYQ